MSEKRLASSGDSFVGLTEMQIVDLLNKLSDENTRLHKKVDEQQSTIQFLQDEIDELKKDIDIYGYEEKKHSETARKLYEENEQLKKQIQIYEQLISNSYVGEEETLDGFVGKYVIWEDELQKYKEKIKKVIDDE